MTPLDIITDSLMEIGAYSMGDPVSAEDAEFGLSKLNDLLDEWAAREVYVYNVNFSLYTLVANLSPHTIGPSSATFTAANRPVRVESASLVLNTSNPSTDVPIAIKDEAWWASQAVKSLTSNQPTALYYSPDVPNGSLYFWPIPTFAYGVRLELWVILQQITDITADLILPPAYSKGLKLSLAEDLCSAFGKTASPMLMTKATAARKAVMVNNVSSPRISTAEAGQSGPSTSTGRRSDFNWQSGQPW